MPNRLYTVQDGDFLIKIARDVLGDEKRWPELAYINELAQPYTIRPGQVLLLPDNSQPLEIIVTKGVTDPIDQTAAANNAGSKLPPATVLLALAAVVFIAMEMDRK